MRVLIVEDDPISAQNLSETLRSLGYVPVGVVHDSKQVERAVRDHDPDMVLLDIHLESQAAGIEAGQAWSRDGRPGLIYLTSDSSRATVDQAIRTKPLAFLVKPVERDVLYATLETARLRVPQASAPGASTAAGLPPHLLKRTLAAIEAQLHDNLTLDELASIAGLSPDHFARLFKSDTGSAPHQYLVARRIERAKQLLAETRDPITQVAGSVGYQSQSHFTTLFRKQTGMTPAAYRRAHRPSG